MGTSFFPQVLNAVPVTTARYSPCRLRFSASVSCPFAFRASSVSVLRASLSFGNSYDSTRNFALQAASGSEEAVSDVASGNEELPEEPAPEESETEGALDSEEKPARKPRIKLGDIMGILNKRAIEASDSQRQTPDIRVGDVVQIKLEVPENRRRLSVYKGIVMSKQNAGIHTTIRIRRIIAGIGVEIVFPVYSPNIKEIRVMSHRKVRRARLYYLRDKLPRLSTFK